MLPSGEYFKCRNGLQMPLPAARERGPIFNICETDRSVPRTTNYQRFAQMRSVRAHHEIQRRLIYLHAANRLFPTVGLHRPFENAALVTPLEAPGPQRGVFASRDDDWSLAILGIDCDTPNFHFLLFDRNRDFLISTGI
jgi:hypothetical protein